MKAAPPAVSRLSTLICAVAALVIVGAVRADLAGAAGNRQETQTGGSIRGTVTSAESGKPIPFAEVTLATSGSPRHRTNTDAAGRYQFGDLAAGQYTISASKNGFVTTRYGETQAGGFKRVAVRDGEHIDRIDLVLVVASAIEGRVVDENGEPIVAAIITAMRAEYSSGQLHLGRAGKSVKTNDKGEYRLFGLLPGEYYVSASLADGEISFAQDPLKPAPKPESTGYAAMFHPGTTDPSDAVRVVLKRDQSISEVNIAFRPVSLVQVRGVVSSATGTLLDGTHVSLVRSGVAGTVAISQVAKNGAFRLEGVPPGKYLLQARSVPMTAIDEVARTGRSLPVTEAKGLEFGSVPLTVDGSLENVKVTTAPPGRIRGSVVRDGTVYKPAGDKVLIRAIAAGPESIAAGATAVVVQG